MRENGLNIGHERQPRRTPHDRHRPAAQTRGYGRTSYAVTRGRHKPGVGRRAGVERLAQQDQHL